MNLMCLFASRLPGRNLALASYRGASINHTLLGTYTLSSVGPLGVQLSYTALASLTTLNSKPTDFP